MSVFKDNMGNECRLGLIFLKSVNIVSTLLEKITWSYCNKYRLGTNVYHTAKNDFLTCIFLSCFAVQMSKNS